jgi:Rod binding domain-containing protein
MDTTNSILTEPTLPSTLLDNLGGISFCEKVANRQANNIDEPSEERKKQVAKDFESVLLNRLLDVMKDTIGDWGFDKDGASDQVQGLFWLHLARDIANKGGFGLWKDIYQFLSNADQPSATVESLK